jgi:hypothetical protein
MDPIVGGGYCFHVEPFVLVVFFVGQPHMKVVRIFL